jgi:putative nucleotidyltransferase with HDIG domain
MTAQRSIHTAHVERAYKEVLYRFMGEVHATKAALYLKQSEAAWTMTTQYGFGRRDRLVESLADDHTIVRMVRAFGEDPRYYNDPNELGKLEGYLAEAGTSRLMLVPLTGPSGLIGFVDVRDKGAQRPFAAGDLDVARSIALALTRQVEIAQAGDAKATRPAATPIEKPSRAEPSPSASAGDRPEEAGDEPPALLDDAGIDAVNAAATEGLFDQRVIAVAVTLSSHRTGATVVHQRSGTPAVELEPVLRHQMAAMAGASVPAPPRSAWKTEIRRAPGQGVAARQLIIASAVILDGEGCSLVASVVTDREPGVAREVMERLGDQAGAARDHFALRLARLGLARKLLQPGNRRYPELVAHSLGVSRLCWSIARVLEFDDAGMETAALAGLLHDVGMRELDYDRLYMHPTPGPEDRRTYRMHVEVGERIVRVEGFGDIADAVRHHHERWDGNGYPDRLANEDIPVLARIVHAAEVFDLFTAANSYRPAVSRERALAILDRAAGHQFDPAVVAAIAKVFA